MQTKAIKKIERANRQIPRREKGFTLIELMVAILIFSLIVFSIISVFVSTSGAHQKAKAIKKVKEDAEYALTSIAKDVRMGTVLKDTRSLSRPLANGTREQYLMVSRNIGGSQSGIVCYAMTANTLSKNDTVVPTATGEIACPQYTNVNYIPLVDLTSTGMKFDLLTGGFYSCPSEFKDSTDPDYFSCPSGVTGKHRGWVEINLNIKMTANKEMETDEIKVQTIVSSRDYGWEEAE